VEEVFPRRLGRTLLFVLGIRLIKQPAPVLKGKP